jgi:type IV fimbrial biogenesis protein FimT
MEHIPAVPRPKRLAPRGFTLVEVLVVIGIVAILAALAAPSFTPTIERFRIHQATEALRSTLYFARSEAIKRGGNVIVQRLTTNGNNCTPDDSGGSGNTDWGCGWQVCTVTANATACAATDPVLQTFDTPVNIAALSNADAPIRFDRWGMVNPPFGFRLFPNHHRPTDGISDPATLGLCMTTGGRIRIVPKEDVPG